ncbi:MAG: type IV toxin-antitoxin system AbiEi family antitoxin [Pseudomonadota bacterium]
MNVHQIFPASSSETQLITEALDGLRESTGITGRLLSHVSSAGAKVSLQAAGKSLQYVCEVKQKIDRSLILDDLKARSVVNQSTLLICNPLTNAMAARCHELDIQFIDTAGNAYITDREGVLIHVTGRKPGKESLITPREMTITPAALRMMFAFLADPSMMNAPYRDISKSVQVATGAIGKIFETLQARAFIGTAPGGNRIMNSPELMLSEWATGYMSRLRPTLKSIRFTAFDADDLRNVWSPEFRISAWGGEVAAEILTKHLNPATYTIYMDMEKPGALSELVQRFRLRSDPHGTIEVVQSFWNMDYFAESFPTVPLHLVYADLLGTHDTRNLAVAKQISREVIDRVHNPTR